MRIPKSVKVFGRIYRVLFHDQIKTGNDNLGSHWGKYSIIYLNKDQDSQALEDCFIHEILEAINYQLNLQLKHGQIIALGTAFYQIIKDNPLTFKR